MLASSDDAIAARGREGRAQGRRQRRERPRAALASALAQGRFRDSGRSSRAARVRSTLYRLRLRAMGAIARGRSRLRRLKALAQTGLTSLTSGRMLEALRMRGRASSSRAGPQGGAALGADAAAWHVRARQWRCGAAACLHAPRGARRRRLLRCARPWQCVQVRLRVRDAQQGPAPARLEPHPVNQATPSRALPNLAEVGGARVWPR